MDQKPTSPAPQMENIHPLHSHKPLYLWVAVAVIVAAAAWLLIAIQTYKIDEEVSTIVTGSLNFSHLRPENKAIAMLQVNGGLCVYGACYSEVTVYADGSYVKQAGQDKQPRQTLGTSAFATLKADIAQINYTEIQSKPFTGTCPTAYDGQEYVFTFFPSTGKETLGSCDVTIDMTQQPFKALQDLQK